MTTHVNQKPLILTGNGATSVSGNFPLDDAIGNMDGVEVLNTDLTQEVFVRFGSVAQTAVATDAAVGAGQRKVFRKNPKDNYCAIIFGAAGVKKVYLTPCNAFDSVN